MSTIKRMTPMERAHLAVQLWWVVGRELHEEYNADGTLKNPKDVLAEIIADEIEEAEQEAINDKVM